MRERSRPFWQLHAALRMALRGIAFAAAVAAFVTAMGLSPARAQERSGSQRADAQKQAPPAEVLEKLAEDIFETVERVSAEVRLLTGISYRGEMVVTHFRPPGPGPFPIVVLSHGRTAANRREPLRWRPVSLARYFTRRGFAVVAPTRIGYGALGQQVDPEAAGPCNAADFRPAFAAMATQVEAAARFAAGLSWADRKRIVLAGASYGGFASIGGASRDIPGLIGAINFAGGMGGSPDRRPADPCQGDQIAGIAGQAGAKSRVPMLWLYAQNDRFWGEMWPERWHQAYVKAGGQAALERFPAVGDDGHKLMSQGFRLWRPVVDRYLASIGIPAPTAGSKLADSGFARIDDAEAVPYLKPQARTEAYVKFLAADIPRAFVVSPTGAWAWRSGPDALEVAMKRCQMGSRSTCTFYAIDDRVVFRKESR